MEKQKIPINDKSFSIAPRTIVVKFKEYVKIPYVDSLEKYFKEMGLASLSEIFQQFPQMTMNRLYVSLSPEEIEKMIRLGQERDDTYKPPNLLHYFRITLPDNVKPESVISKLNEINFIEKSYVEGGPTPPPVVNSSNDPRSTNQGYLGTAPAGVDARYAWTFTGGDGAGIQFVDMERGWTLTHEDLVAKGISLISGLNQDFFGHGTAVLGEVVAVDNTIGDVGIAPNVTSARVVSQWRTATNYNTSDAILSAISALNFGDVLLLEAQTVVGSSSYLPVEAEDAAFDTIRLATALGVIVIEAGGNGSTDLDNFTDASSKQVLNRSSIDFRDSGAIMAGASSSTAPHGRLGFSNYGSRIDCYAWGQSIDTTGDGWTGNLTTSYTTSFGGTSGASPIIAGAALCVQGIVNALGHRFSPLQMRAILSNATTGTLSANPSTDKIGVMPDLRQIIDANLGLRPEVYIRDNPMDDGGVPVSGPISTSPDIILRPNVVADPTLSFGEGSGVENSMDLGYGAESGQDNYIYVRLKNRGGIDAANVSVKVYWSQVASLITPDMWNLIGTITVPSVPTGDTLVVGGPLVWQAADIPATGHYCFVGLVDHPLDPAPLLPNLINFANFETYIRTNNNVTWRNFNVVNNIPPSAPPPSARLKGFIPLPFLMVGAPDKQIQMDVEIIRKLPRHARLFLEGPAYISDLLKVPKQLVEIDRERKRALILIPSLKNTLFKDVNFHAKTKHECKLWMHVDDNKKKYRYFVAVRQVYKDLEVGRMTWMIQNSDQKKIQRQS